MGPMEVLEVLEAAKVLEVMKVLKVLEVLPPEISNDFEHQKWIRSANFIQLDPALIKSRRF